MWKKGALLFFSGLLLAACGSESREESSASQVEDTAVETELDNDSTETIESSAHYEVTDVNSFDEHMFENLINITTFTIDQGFEAWTEYKKVTSQYKVSDISVAEDLFDGSSSAEIDEMMGNHSERGEVELSDREKMVFYRYAVEPPAEEGGMPTHLAEITFYFIDDHLMSSSITPGFYSVELNTAQKTETLATLLSVEQVKELNPQVFTVAEMNLNGETIRQLMISSQPLEDQTDSAVNAFYFFTLGDEIIYYAALPFMNVAQDFPTSSVQMFYNFFTWMSEEEQN